MTDLTLVTDGLPAGHGPLGLLSGDEFTEPATDFDRALGVAGKTIGLILDADHRAAPNSARVARAHFETLDARVVELDMHADGPLPDHDIAYIGGGSPEDLLACLRDNPRWLDVEKNWREGKGLAGSSAGAMALCTQCLVAREGDHVPTVWSRGLGPITGVALAVHASSRDERWIERVTRNSPVPVLALDDATGIIVTPGNPVIAAGPGRVWFAATRL